MKNMPTAYKINSNNTSLMYIFTLLESNMKALTKKTGKAHKENNQMAAIWKI